MKLIIPLLVLLVCNGSSAFNMREFVQTMEVAEEEVVADNKDSAVYNWANHALFDYMKKLHNEVSFPML